MKNLVVFASGRGSNFNAIINAINEGKINAKISALITDKICPAIQISKENNVDYKIVKPKDFQDKDSYINELIKNLDVYKPDLIILAGYMRIIPSQILDIYPMKIINIHPSLLPSYPGMDSIKRAWEDRATYSGVTVHYVNDGIDQGPIIIQEKVKICDDLGKFEEAIHKVEHNIYIDAINKVLKSFDFVIVSNCLIEDGYRYNNESKISKRVKKIINDFEGKVYKFCPEAFLGVPRKPMDYINNRIISIDGVDFTDEIKNNIEAFIGKIDPCSNILAILKENSPSCGVKKIGLFTKSIKEKFKNVLIVSEREI